MMDEGWNNRIMRHEREWNGIKQITYAVHEVHYIDDKVWCWTKDSMCGHYESIKDLIMGLLQMARDAWQSRHTILDYNMEPEADYSWEDGTDVGGNIGKEPEQQEADKAMNSRYLVGRIEKNRYVGQCPRCSTGPLPIKLSWADGMVGVVPIFETKEAAKAYANGYMVVELEVSNG